MDQSSRFWDRIADKYARKPVPDETTYQEKLRKSREYFRPEMNVVEFGCGTGSTALAHAPFVRHIQALDISDRMLEIAREKAKQAGVTNVTFTRSDLFGVTIEDASIDAVLGMSILHLLDDRDATIDRVHRILKPGGVFISSTVCIADTKAFLRYILPIGRWLRLMPLVRVFTLADLENSLERAGFDLDYKWRPDATPDVYFLVAIKR